MIDVSALYQRIFIFWSCIGQFLSKYRKDIFSILLWSVVVGVALLPTLSQVGYFFYSIEYIIIASLALIVGIALHFISRVKFFACISIVFITTFTFLLYFGGMIVDNHRLIYLIVPALLAFTMLAAANYRSALRISGLVAFSQIATTAFFIQHPGISTTRNDVDTRDIPSVVHILMDGHAGIATFPDEAIGRDEVRRLEEMYVSRGFTVFRRAYAASDRTFDSIALMFDGKNGRDSVLHDKKNHTFAISKASVLEIIAERRALDLTFTNFVDLRPAVKNVANVAGTEMFTANGRGRTPGLENMPIRGRLWIMASMTQSWFTSKLDSPLALWFFEMTDTGRDLKELWMPANRTAPIVSRWILDRFLARLQCCGEGGTYYFAHLIYPHGPYIFTSNCEVKPPSDWMISGIYPRRGKNTFSTRIKRWRQYFEQLKCSAADAMRVVDVVDQRPELADATIIIHGDHGARIIIDEDAVREIDNYDRQTYEQDTRGTFFAVRLPAQRKGKVIDAPVRIDDIFRHLTQGDFETLNARELNPRKDSPFHSSR